MTPERFREIVDAYGAMPRRWPESERAAAEAFAHTSSHARDLLAREAELDRLMDAYRIAPADGALTRAIIASVPPRRGSAGGYFLKGLGIVSAGLAGAVAGAILMSVYAPVAPMVADDADRPIFTSFDASVVDFDPGETQ